MDWLLPRLLTSAVGVLVGGMVGMLAGAWLDAPLLGAFFGAIVGVVLASLRDAIHGQRLLQWLRSTQDTQAPRDTGFWGEIGYRIERSLRQRERSIVQERERLAQFLSAIEASPNGVMLLDPNEQIEWCNSVAADHFGLDPVRDHLQRVTNLVRAPAFVAYLGRGQFDEPVTFATGPQGRTLLTVLIRTYGEGMRLVITQDVTQRERADSMRRDFVANVSHEIRTPLTVLAGFIETMAALPLSETERRRVLATMKQQTDRMQTLVGDLLTLAQIEGSPRPAPDRWTALDKLLAQVALDAETLSGGRHRLSFPPPTHCEVAGSDAELVSAIANLVGNAVRYTPDGGSIDVSWRRRPDGAGELEVRDTGIGIDKEHLPRLTERFYRVDGSRSRDTGGTGLGLSIVKHVVLRHGGELDIRSELGKGSRFRLVLPSARLRLSAAAGQPAKVGA